MGQIYIQKYNIYKHRSNEGLVMKDCHQGRVYSSLLRLLVGKILDSALFKNTWISIETKPQWYHSQKKRRIVASDTNSGSDPADWLM